MGQNLTKVEDIFLDKMALMCKKYGFNHIMAQLYAILYFSNKALSLDEMSERLNISKGSASVNIRALERYGAVRHVLVKGSRKDYYEPESDVAKVIKERIQAMVKGRLGEIEDILRSSCDALNAVVSNDESEEEAVRAAREKLGKLKDLYEQAKSLFDLFNNGILSKEYIKT